MTHNFVKNDQIGTRYRLMRRTGEPMGLACQRARDTRRPSQSVKNRLRVLQAEREWSQATLAQRLEVSRQTVNAVEIGKYDFGLPLAFKIARLFELRIEQIFDPGDGGRSAS